MLTHANFLGEVEAVFNWVDLGPDDALLGVLPLFHVLAQMANLLLPLVKGSRVVYLETLNTTELLRALTERNITAFAVVPQFFYLIHERVMQEIAKRGAAHPESVQRDGCVQPHSAQGRHQCRPHFLPQSPRNPGAEDAIPGHRRVALRSWMARAFLRPWHRRAAGYGLTETTAAIFANSPRDNEIGSVGKAHEGCGGKDHRSSATGRGPASRRSRLARRGRDERILEPSGCH